MQEYLMFWPNLRWYQISDKFIYEKFSIKFFLKCVYYKMLIIFTLVEAVLLDLVKQM